MWLLINGWFLMEGEIESEIVNSNTFNISINFISLVGLDYNFLEINSKVNNYGSAYSY